MCLVRVFVIDFNCIWTCACTCMYNIFEYGVGMINVFTVPERNIYFCVPFL